MSKTNLLASGGGIGALSVAALFLMVGCSSGASGGSTSGTGTTTDADGGRAVLVSPDSGASASDLDGGGSTSNPDSGGASAATPGTVGATCSTSAPCGAGLTCAQSGELLGRCTADCSSDYGLCASQFGADSVCINGSQCALTCTTGGAPCPGAGQCVDLSGGTSACISNPDGPPDAAPPPNGACSNVGGAFGDTVANGGYRCTPGTGDSPSTTIDLCNDGVWTTATYTCSCQVNGDPSDCVDFQDAGVASCEYGLESCAQCDTTGCHSP